MDKNRIITQLKWDNSYIWMPELLFICSFLVTGRTCKTGCDDGGSSSQPIQKCCYLCDFFISRNSEVQGVSCTILKHFRKMGRTILWRCYHHREKHLLTNLWMVKFKWFESHLYDSSDWKKALYWVCQGVGARGAAGVASVRNQGLPYAGHSWFQLSSMDPLDERGWAYQSSWWWLRKNTFKRGQNTTEEEGTKEKRKIRGNTKGQRNRRRMCSRYQSRYPLPPTKDPYWSTGKVWEGRISREKLLCTDQSTPALCCLQQGRGKWSESVKKREGKMLFINFCLSVFHYLN